MISDSLFFKKRNDIPSRISLCFSICLSIFYSSFSLAAISAVASEQSGATVAGNPSHVGAGTLATRNNCGNITPSTPAGSVGDLLIAVATVRETNATVTMPAGWTLYYTENHGVGGNQDLEAYIFYRIADNTATDTATMTSGGTGNCRSLIGQVSRFTGVDTASPFETDPIVAGNSSTQNTANVTTGTETTTTANAMSIAVTFINDNATVTTADSFTESFDSPSNTGRDSAISLSYRQETTAGAKGPFTWAQTLGTDESIGVLFALTPDPTTEAVTINVPAGTTTDDVMLAAIAVGPSTTGIAAPAGWTLINRVDQAAATSNSQAVYYRIATSSEPASYTWTFSGGAISGTAGGIITYRGVDTASPIDASGGNTTASSLSHQANSINTTVANTMVVSIHSFSSSEAWTPPVSPAGMTEQVDITSAGTLPADGISLGMFDVIQATAGATGNITATVGANADTGVAQIVALTPTVISSGITVTFSAAPRRILAGSISVTDAALGTPELSATNVNGGDSAAITTNIGPTLTNNALLIDIVGKPRGDNTYTPGAGQIERWDNELAGNGNGATGAMSTKQVSAASDSMTQTHSNATRRNAQAVVSIAPVDGSSTATFDAVASASVSNSTTLNWTHTFSTSTTFNTKLIVGVTYRVDAACGGISVSSVTFGNLTMSQVAATSVSDGTRCQYSELWYVDLNDIIVSTNNNSTLGGQAIDQDEAVEYNVISDTGTLFFDDATFANNETLDAIHVFNTGNLAISTNGNANIDGNVITDGDIIIVAPTATTGVYSFVGTLFDESNFVGNEDVNAVYVRDNGNIILSTDSPAGLPQCGGGTLNFSDDDLVEWDITNTCATMFLDESTTGNLIPNAGGDEDIVGVHLLNDNDDLILFSLAANNTILTTAVLDGDVVLYDRANSTASIYFSESNFTSGGEDIDALTLTTAPFTPPLVDHYAISYPLGTPGVTCEALAVRITAHGDASDHANIVAPSNTTTITLSESPAADGWALRAGGGTFIPPNQYTFDGVETFVDFWLTETTATTVPHIDIDVTDGTSTDLDGVFEDDNIEFADAVFRFFADGTGEGIGTQIAGKESDINPDMQTIQLRSVITNSTTMACETRITGSTAIDMAYKCNNPTTCETSATATRVQIENSAASTFDITPGNDNAATVDAVTGNYDSVTLDFGVTGTATLSFDFNDAGQIQLFARQTLAAVDPDPVITVFGASNSFVVRPAGLCVESTDTNSDCASGDGTCSAFRKAGSVDTENFFNLTVRGVTWETTGETDSDFCSGTNATTPNFQLNSIALSHSKIAPVGGTSQTGSLSVSSLDILAAADGAHTEANQAISEVGVFTITATPPAYLGETIAASTSANIGRFYPDRFNVTMQNTPAFADSCSGFTYIDQPFYYGVAPVLQIEALNSNGITTNNYGGSFWKLTSSTLPRSYIDGSAVAPNATFFSTIAGAVTLAGETDFDGIGTLALDAGTSADAFMYQKGLEEAAFNADVDATFQAAGFQDTDHTAMNPVCYDSTNDGTCNGFTYVMIQGTELRWGRMVLSNGFGSELLPVEIPIRAEYFTTGGFIINTADTCTTYDSANISFSNENGVTNGANLVASDSGTLVNGVDNDANPLLISNSLTEVGSVDVTLNISAQDWLRYDWDDADMMGDGPYDDDPSSRVTWGIFSGPDEIIYIREPW